MQRLGPARDERDRARVRLVEVERDRAGLGDGRARVRVEDDGERVQGRAVAPFHACRRADLLAQGLDVGELDPDGAVGDALDVQRVPARAHTLSHMSHEYRRLLDDDTTYLIFHTLGDQAFPSALLGISYKMMSSGILFAMGRTRH